MVDPGKEGLVEGVRTVCGIVRTALGPFGANKLLVQPDGTVTTTSSSTELLERLDVTDPAITLVEATASGFRERRGDGAGGVVVLTGALVREAARLEEQGVHPTAIGRGYRAGLDAALTAVDGAARPLSEFGAGAVARTALTGTRDPRARRAVGDAVADAVDRTGEAADAVNVVSRTGGAVGDTRLVSGIVLERGPTTEAMPRSPGRTRVALLSSTVDVPNVGSQDGRVARRVTVNAESFDDRAAVADFERDAFEARLDAAVEAGCGAVFTERAINERVESVLGARGVLGIERVDDAELRRLARATGAKVVPTLEQVSEETLGTATVRVERTAGRDVTLVTGGAGDPAYTLFCRAPDPRSAEAFERSAEAAVASTAAAVRDGRIVPGGGAVEATAAEAVRREARSLSDRRQLAASAYGDALAAIPRTLAETAGLDGLEAAIRLRVARSEGNDAVGVDALAGATRDVLGDDPIVEPRTIKRAAMTTATELATQLVGIDERLSATDLGDGDGVGATGSAEARAPPGGGRAD
jgi:chaperonin GroEL (HSP60 family)